MRDTEDKLVSDWSCPTQLDRIEAMLTVLLEIAKKPKRTNGRKTHEYTASFEEIWEGYPTRAGTNSKQKAFTAYRMRQMEGVTITELQSGVGRYFEYCRLTGKLKTEYVMAASRFFGSGREYENEWHVPKQPKKLNSDQDWIAAGIDKGIEARTGETMAELKRRVEVALR